MPSDIGTDNFIFNSRNGSDQAFIRIEGASQLLPANTDGSGCFHGNRSSSTAVQGYRNGVLLGTGSIASASLDARIFWFSGRNSAGGFQQYSARQQAAGWAGGSLTAGQVLAMYNALAAYMTGVGAA